MPRKNLPYVSAYKDRTGKMRYYLRRPGCRQVPLSGRPGTREFIQSYAAATALPAKSVQKKVRLQPQKGFVYYLSDGEHVKIGYTKDWNERSKKYRTHSAREITVLAIRPGYKSEETALHRKFKVYRKRGDWFYPGEAILDHIKRTVDELNAA